MLFYEVQLCVQQPSSCCSNVLCCSGNLREVRGMKDSVSAFHLLFHSWDTMVCWTEQGVPTDLAVHQICWWSGGPELFLCPGFLELGLRVFEKKCSMENGCFRGLHQYSKICCKKSEAADFSYLLNLLTGFHINFKISPLMSATDISELTRSVTSKKHLLNNKVLIFMRIAYLFRDLKSYYRLNELLHTPQAEVQRS